jgi:YD repeat-containing protein
MTGATEKDNTGAVIMRATYTYDALDRRIGVDVDADGAGAGAAVQTWTAYDGQNTYADFDGSGTLAPTAWPGFRTTATEPLLPG